MTYLEREAEGGAPIECYKFVRQGAKWLYTSGDAPITIGTETFLPVVIHRTAPESGEETDSGAIDISLDKTLAVVPEHVSGSSPTPVWVVVFRQHRTGEQAIIFQGQVSAIALRGGEATFHCTPTRRSLERLVPRMLYQRMCNHVLYDAGCKVIREEYRVDVEVLSVEGNELEVLGLATWSVLNEPWSQGGFLQIPDTTIRGFIQQEIIHDPPNEHISTLVLLRAIPGITVGMDLWVYAGCDRLEETCHIKFSNIVNFLGFPDIPNQSPFGGILATVRSPFSNLKPW